MVSQWGILLAVCSSAFYANKIAKNILVHLSTFLALVIPNETTAVPLSPKSFLAVWVLTSIPFAILSGLFEHAALALTGITGG